MSFFKSPFKRSNTSIIRRVNAWYSGFILLILLGFFGLALLLTSSFATSVDQSFLQEEAIETAQNLAEDEDDLEGFDDGIYYSIYNDRNQSLQSFFPSDFDSSLPYSNGQVLESRGNQHNYYYIDTKIPGSNHWLRAVTSQGNSNPELQLFLLTLAGIAPFLIAIVSWGGYRILKTAFRPVEAIGQTANRIRLSQDFSQRIPQSQQNNELTQLAATINHMLETVESTFKREQQLTNDVSHELRTPLTVILSESQYGRDYAQTLEEAQESNGIIHRQALHMKNLVEQILELARLEEGHPVETQLLDFSLLVKEKASDFRRMLETDGITVDIDIQSNIQLRGHATQLQRLLDNLLSNARKFTSDWIHIQLKADEKMASLRISDNGSGIPTDQLDHIWEKFYQISQDRNKNQDQGIGLGLSLVRQIVHQHQGQIQVESQVGQGSCFIVNLPVDLQQLEQTK